MQPDNKIYNFSLASVKTDSADGGVRVHLSGNVRFHHGDCIFSGFYVSEPVSGIRQGWADISLREAPVPEYEHYCLADINPAPRGNSRKALPPCVGMTANRIPVSIWKPELTPNGELRSAPPEGDGRIVYASIDVKKDASGGCLGWSDGRFHFHFPDKKGAPDTKGLVVSLRGNDRQEPDSCRLSGYYMNEPRFEKQDGWRKTYFGSIDPNRLIGSGQYCLSRESLGDSRSR